MTLTIDLNSDMGEAFGPWQMGEDSTLLDIVTSANIACGFHAGDPDVMAQVMAEAAARGVGIGAHPGFADLQGFGRRRMDVPGDSLGNLVRYQLGAAQGMARAAGGRVRHLKLHGALSNMTSEDAGMARSCYSAALDLDPDLIVVVLAGTAQETAVRALGCRWAGEIFADRAYNDDATLVDRRLPGAVIHDTDDAARRITAMLRDGAIHTASGGRIPAAIDTVCVHGDTPEAVGLARGLRAALIEAGITVAQMEGRR
ncbi:LamB/YcsF family protein [Anianabacter salinae]|uniref:LamB/YcsF family protein n=1 Tax=Anianabacter salinae TaxID=2851023 RepID=UPI00225E67D1|nr:5-oxoprolinase subunit PxpA [Anianabacter salinae]MBV0912365.1 LamB/YcsF family protein [Anianabacter salinae]